MAKIFILMKYWLFTTFIIISFLAMMVIRFGEYGHMNGLIFILVWITVILIYLVMPELYYREIKKNDI